MFHGYEVLSTQYFLSYISTAAEVYVSFCYPSQVKTLLSITEEDRDLLRSKLNDEITARHELEGAYNKQFCM